MRRKASALVLAFAIALSASARAATDEAHELAKKLNNPISDLVSVPFQFNWEFGNGPNDDMHHVANLQPVVPFHITEHTNLIARLIMPTISTPQSTVAGDMTFSLFFSPAKSGGLIWGAGPAALLPRTGPKWAIGPTAVALKQNGAYTYGVLANQLWSFTGDEQAADLSQFFFQPFFAHTSQKAVTLALQSESTANWNAPEGNVWTVPLIAQVSKMAKFGLFPASYAAGVGFYLDAPTGGPEWKLRSVITVLIPASK